MCLQVCCERVCVFYTPYNGFDMVKPARTSDTLECDFVVKSPQLSALLKMCKSFLSFNEAKRNFLAMTKTDRKVELEMRKKNPLKIR